MSMISLGEGLEEAGFTSSLMIMMAFTSYFSFFLDHPSLMQPGMLEEASVKKSSCLNGPQKMELIDVETGGKCQ